MASVIEAPKVYGLIPARLAATRFPNKPLADLQGKPMIQHVWERAQQAEILFEVAVATPDEEIVRTVEAFGGRAIRTSSEHRTGTDRLAEAAEILRLKESDIVVNIQGDEPLLDPSNIETLARLLMADPEVPMSSLMCVCPEEDIASPSCVKVVCALNGNALYFSRSSIPYPRQVGNFPVYQHIGLYAYRRYFLKMLSTLPPSPLEVTEGLEQLRVLEHGHRIRMAYVPNAPIGVDTPEDLDRVRRILEIEQDFASPVSE